MSIPLYTRRFALAFAAFTSLLISSSPADLGKATPVGKKHRSFSSLHKNGSAIRTKLGIKIYKVDLYVSSKSEDEKVIFKNRDPKRIKITMLREVTGKKFESTVRKNIATNFSTAEKKQWHTELEKFLACFVDDILEKDSIVMIDYIPDAGMRVSVDGKVKDTIAGSDYYHALLRLWIGNPPQKSVKHGLLGRKH